MQDPNNNQKWNVNVRHLTCAYVRGQRPPHDDGASFAVFFVLGYLKKVWQQRCCTLHTPNPALWRPDLMFCSEDVTAHDESLLLVDVEIDPTPPLASVLLS